MKNAEDIDPSTWVESNVCPPNFDPVCVQAAREKLWLKLATRRGSFGSQAGLATAIAKHARIAKKGAKNELEQRSTGAIQVDLVALFSGKEPLQSSLEDPMRRAIADLIRDEAEEVDMEWRSQVKAALHVVSRDSFRGREHSREALLSSMTWADSILIASNGLDPIMRAWELHPLDAVMHELLLNPRKEQVKKRGRPGLHLTCPCQDDVVRWLAQASLPHYINAHWDGKDLWTEAWLKDRNARSSLTRTVSSFIEPLLEAVRVGHICLYSAPRTSFYLPFITAKHGHLKHTYLNLCGESGPLFMAVPSNELAHAFEYAATASNARFIPDERELKRKLIGYFYRFFQMYAEGKAEGKQAFEKGKALKPPIPLEELKTRRRLKGGAAMDGLTVLETP